MRNVRGLPAARSLIPCLPEKGWARRDLATALPFPHGRIKGLEDAVAAVFRLVTPIPFDAPDGHPVGILIFLLVPEQATQQHLELLSEVAEML